MIRTFNYLILVICAVIIYSLFAIKDKVSMLRYQLGTAKQQVIQEKNNIHVLKAEFAYLSSPERLQKLAALYLDSVSIKTSQLIKDPLKDNSTTAIASKVETNKYSKSTTSRNIKWRFKKGPTKYVQTVSHKSAR